MYPVYADLREKLGAPSWHDKHGVPRHCEFHPTMLDVYDDWAVMMEVECQACGKTFACAGHFSKAHECVRSAANKFDELSNVDGALRQMARWGDAPWHDSDGNEATFEGQCSGTTMSTAVVDIHQVWMRVTGEWAMVEVTDDIKARFTEASDHGYEQPWLTSVEPNP